MEKRTGEGRGGEQRKVEEFRGEGRRGEERREEGRGENTLSLAPMSHLSPPLHALTTRGYTCVHPQLVVHALNGRFSSYLP